MVKMSKKSKPSSSTPSKKAATATLTLNPTIVKSITSGLTCASLKCLATPPTGQLQICSGCSCLAFCGQKCQGEGWALAHSKVCSRMKGASWGQRVKLVNVMIHQAKKMSANSTRRPVSPVVSNSDDTEYETDSVDDNDTDEDENDIHPTTATTWDMSLSPIRQTPGSPIIYPLVRFSCLSTSSWNREVDVITVKVWKDMKLSSVGLFNPVQEEDPVNLKFQVFSNAGQLIHQQEEEELFPTDLAEVGEMKLSRPVRLEAHRRYFLVVKMGGMACCVGEEGSYLHCLQTEKGGIQVAFETPEREELEEFLEVAENFTSTVRGQIPALFFSTVD